MHPFQHDLVVVVADINREYPRAAAPSSHSRLASPDRTAPNWWRAPRHPEGSDPKVKTIEMPDVMVRSRRIHRSRFKSHSLSKYRLRAAFGDDERRYRPRSGSAASPYQVTAYCRWLLASVIRVLPSYRQAAGIGGRRQPRPRSAPDPGRALAAICFEVVVIPSSCHAGSLSGVNDARDDHPSSKTGNAADRSPRLPTAHPGS